MRINFVISPVFAAVVIAVLFLPLQSLAQANLTGVPSLRVEPDPVSTGRGFTGVARPERTSAIFWNPAGLAFQEGPQVGISRFKWLPRLDDKLSYNYLLGRYPAEGIGMLGSGISYINLGEQSIRDHEGNKGGDFSSYELSVSLSVGRVILPRKLSVGLGIRFISSRLAPPGLEIGSETVKTGNTAALDVGAFYLPGDVLLGNSTVRPTLGMSLTNFGGKVSYSSSGIKSPLPTTLRLGGAAKVYFDSEETHTLTSSIEFSKLMVRVDSTGAHGAFQALFSSWDSYTYYNGRDNIKIGLGKQIMYGAGLEYWYDNLTALRTGYYNESVANGGRKFITLGGSIRYQYIEVNASYALQQGQNAGGNIFRIGLLLNL